MGIVLLSDMNYALPIVYRVGGNPVITSLSIGIYTLHLKKLIIACRTKSGDPFRAKAVNKESLLPFRFVLILEHTKKEGNIREVFAQIVYNTLTYTSDTPLVVNDDLHYTGEDVIPVIATCMAMYNLETRITLSKEWVLEWAAQYYQPSE